MERYYIYIGDIIVFNLSTSVVMKGILWNGTIFILVLL